MGTSQFAFVRMPPGKWASSDSLARVPASGVPTVRSNFALAVSDPPTLCSPAGRALNRISLERIQLA